MLQITRDDFWFSSLESVFIGLAAGGIVGALLCAWACKAVYERKSYAPSRCRILLTLNIAAVILGALGIAIFIAFQVWRGGENLLDFLVQNDALGAWQSGLPGTLSCLLVSGIICEAWRRYFLLSPKVRQAFGLHHPSGYSPELPPAEIALFTIICWLCPAYYGLTNLVWQLFYFRVPLTGDGATIFLTVQSLITAAYLILPFVALYALRLRRGMLRMMFWCLGLWLGVQALIWLVEVINYFTVLSSGQYEIYNYTYRLPRLLSERLFVPLAFWWYFAVSQKARAWFDATDLPWEEKAARL